MWAEEVGIGEMGLMPEQFWGLTYREFQIKHAAFKRAEDRVQALVVMHARLTGSYDAAHKRRLLRWEGALRRYPLKKWLLPPPEA